MNMMLIYFAIVVLVKKLQEYYNVGIFAKGVIVAWEIRCAINVINKI